MKKLMILAAMIMIVGCGEVVPAGSIVIVKSTNGDETIVDKGTYTAYGRDKAYLVSTHIKTFSKDLKILCADDINMAVRVKWVGKFNVKKDTVASLMEDVEATSQGSGKYTIDLSSFYDKTMSDMMSSTARNIISTYKTDNISDHRIEIAKKLKETIINKVKSLKYPVETLDVLITNLDFPKQVTEQRQRIKEAELKELENAALAKAEVARLRKEAEMAIERGKAEVAKERASGLAEVEKAKQTNLALIEIAKGKAEADRLRSAALTPQIMELKRYEAMVGMAAGNKGGTLILPYEALEGKGNDLKSAVILNNSMQK